MKFGIIKSKIDTILIESYNNGTFKTEMSNFKKYVLNNKNINKLFYLYDELSTNKGLNESIVDDYINESIVIYENTINKISNVNLKPLLEWVKNIKTENQYEVIDNLFSDNVLTLENKIQSKKIIKESLTKKEIKKDNVIDIPLSSMINIANKTIVNFYNQLSESEQKELISLLSEDDSELKNQFGPLKESVLNKLTTLKRETTDYETGKRINETIEKVNSETYNKLGFFKLKSLNENL